MRHSRATKTRSPVGLSKRSELRFHGDGHRVRRTAPWHDIIPAGQWSDYRMAMEAAREAGISFLVGGGFGLAGYTGRWRNTKDLDLYILPGDRDAMVAALSNIGFNDYFGRRPYDPGWIYRSIRKNIIVDIIWSMANRRAKVDEVWFERARAVTVREETLHLVPAEELLWCKLYILQRDHCDWPDIFNLLQAVGPQLDWEHMLERTEEDLPLLRAALTIFDWLCPGRAAELPSWLRKQMGLQGAKQRREKCERERIKMLDSRNWFASLQSEDKFLEV